MPQRRCAQHTAVIFETARDGLLPGILARVHAKHHTPHIAILFYAASGCAVALAGTFKQLAVVASGPILLVYLGVNLAVIALRRRGGPSSGEQFRIPGGPIVPICSSAVVVWLLLQMTTGEAIAVGTLLAVTVLSFFARKAFRKSASSPS
jgi:basic amino acid/polyamine antiporter, APA family